MNRLETYEGDPKLWRVELDISTQLLLEAEAIAREKNKSVTYIIQDSVKLRAILSGLQNRAKREFRQKTIFVNEKRLDIGSLKTRYTQEAKKKSYFVFPYKFKSKVEYFAATTQGPESINQYIHNALALRIAVYKLSDPDKQTTNYRVGISKRTWMR